MEKTKVVRAHHTSLNPNMLGYPLYVYVLFSTYNIKPEIEKKFISYLTSHSQIVYVAKNSGQYDFTIAVCAREYLEFDEIIRQIRQKFTDVIKNYTTCPTIQEYKFDWMVDLI